MSVDIGPDQGCLLDGQIVQNTIKRFARNINFILSLPDTFSHRCLGQRICQEIPSMRDRTFVGAESSWRRLLQILDLTNKRHLMVVPENACGMPLASLDLIGKVIDDPDIDLVYSDQIIGLLPLVISKRFLEKIVTRQSSPGQRLTPLRILPKGNRFLTPIKFFLTKVLEQKSPKSEYHTQALAKIYEFCESKDRVQKIRFFHNDIENNPIPYFPQRPKDKSLVNYLLEQTPALENILRDVDQLPVSDSSGLFSFFKEFRDTFAITYPIYQLEGQPEIPEEIRGLTSNPKSVGHCYLIAINLTKFLKRYAGLRNTSHVLDIGCGWGVLALGLVNLIEDSGSYLGLDIQRDAIAWAQKNIAPLNPTFSFKHIDVTNSAYNPKGGVQAEEAHLPIENDSVDLVVLSSVFTHMRREGIERYLKEIRRVLAQGGIVAFSYFHSSFFGNNEDYRVRFPDNPDRMTLFNTKEMRRILSACGLRQARPQVNYNARLNPTKTFFQTFMFATRND